MIENQAMFSLVHVMLPFVSLLRPLRCIVGEIDCSGDHLSCCFSRYTMGNFERAAFSFVVTQTPPQNAVTKR